MYSITPGIEKKDNRNEKFPVVLRKGGIAVRIYRLVSQEGYNHYTVSYYQSGQRKREVLGDEKDARERAKWVLDSLVEGEVEAAGMKLQDIKAYTSAQRLLETCGVSPETACLEYAKAFQVLKGRASVLRAVEDYMSRHEGVIEGKTVAEVAKELLEAKEKGVATTAKSKAGKVSDRYLEVLKTGLDRLKKEFTGPIADMTAERINTYIAGLKHYKTNEDVSGRTRNNYLEPVRSLLLFAQRQRYLPSNSRILEELVTYAEEDFEIEIFTVDEMTRLLAVVSDLLAPPLAIGAFSGVRYYEITRLDWSEINLEAGHIEIKARKAKTRSRRLVPISANLAAWLKNYRKESGPLWPRATKYMAGLLIQCGEKAGIKWKHNALRHSYISYRVAELKSVDQVALESGNSPNMIFQHYRELVTAKQGAEWFGITPAKVKAFIKRQKTESEKRTTENTEKRDLKTEPGMEVAA